MTIKTIPAIYKGQSFDVQVDGDDFERLSLRQWRVLKRNKSETLYAVTYRHIPGSRSPKCEYMHRIIMGEPVDMDVDHANGNGLDNRKCNLRVCTHSQNQGNQQKPSTNTSGFKGVHPCSKTGRWVAQITKDKVKRVLGRFNTPEEAHEVYKKAAISLFGEFARFK